MKKKNRKKTKFWELTDEHREQIPAWNQRWIEIIRSTEPIDFEKTAQAVIGMYKAAKIPTNGLRIVYARSVIEGMIVHAYAAAWWALYESCVSARRGAACVAINDGTEEKTRIATMGLTRTSTIVGTSAPAFDAMFSMRNEVTADSRRAGIGDVYARNSAIIDAAFAAKREATETAMRAEIDDGTQTRTEKATASAAHNAARSASRCLTRSEAYSATEIATSSVSDAISVATNSAMHDAKVSAIVSAALPEIDDGALAEIRDKAADATLDATFDNILFATENATSDAASLEIRVRTRNVIYRSAEVRAREVAYFVIEEATRAAIRSGTDKATSSATAGLADDSTRDASDRETCNELESATQDATDSATGASTCGADDVAIEQARRAMIRESAEALTEGAIGFDRLVRAMCAGAESAFPESERAAIRRVAMRNVGSVSALNGGSEWASWCAYLSFVRDVVGWKHRSHKAYAHYEAAQIHGGPRWMHRQFVVLCDRPRLRLLDDEGALHCESGPAIEWRCGTRHYYIHGVRVDEQIVMRPETQTIEQIDSENNSEVRRVRIERFGWERYMRESGARLIDKRFNERDMQEERLYLFKDKTKRFFCVDPSTGRQYVKGMPRRIKSCQAAQDWLTHGLDRRAVHRS